MDQTLSNFFCCALVALSAAIPWSAASGQAIKVAADEPFYGDLVSPEFNATKGKTWKQKSWLEMEFKANVSISPAPKSEICDRLTVKWFLAVQNPEKSNTFFLITKEVQHVNIPLGEDVYFSAYLSPASIHRIVGPVRNVAKIVEYVGFEVIYNGETVAAATSKGKVGWWKVTSPHLSLTETVSLMDKSKTPFSHMWWDRYAEVDSITK